MRTLKDYSLKTHNPMLAREWDRKKNDGMTPKDVTPGSGKKVWWQCKRGHSWQAVIASRNSGVGCPYCAGKRAEKTNCLKTQRPDLAREWHPTKNRLLTAEAVTRGSHRIVWWQCAQGHNWKTSVKSRTGGTGCPYCRGRKVDQSNALKTRKPALAMEWHKTKNAQLTPGVVLPGSERKVWWQCGKGHEWQAVIGSRSAGRGCPYCAARKTCADNCLANRKPALAAEWHLAKNMPLTPKDVTPGSGKKVWWRCKEGHEWQAAVLDRNHGKGCPYCAGNRPTYERSLKAMNPGLARQWHPTMNNSLMPKDVFPHSRREVWWRCHKGHEWKKAVRDRSRGSGCPVCIAGER